MNLSDLKEQELIISANYWENFSFHKTLAQALGVNHPKTKYIEKETNKIREEWHSLKQEIQKLENEKDNN